MELSAEIAIFLSGPALAKAQLNLTVGDIEGNTEKIIANIREAYVQEDRSPKEIAAMGFDETTVRRVIGIIDRNEYKRRQAAPGVKITSKAFGRDRRLPITNRFRE